MPRAVSEDMVKVSSWKCMGETRTSFEGTRGPRAKGNRVERGGNSRAECREDSRAEWREDSRAERGRNGQTSEGIPVWVRGICRFVGAARTGLRLSSIGAR